MNSSEYLEQHAELLAEKWLPQSDNKEAIQAWMQVLTPGRPLLYCMIMWLLHHVTTYKMSVQSVSENSLA